MKSLLLILLFSLPVGATTFYVSPTGSGSVCTSGSPCSLTTAVGGSAPVQPGDTVELAGGIYRVSDLHFEPQGTSPSVITKFVAAAGALPIITNTDDTPPVLTIKDYTRLDGLWMGGTRVETPTGIFMGNSPISHWVQIVNCTIFNYADGLEVGSAEYHLIQGNRFVNCGQGAFYHCIYASGNETPGTEPQHGIIDNNLFVAGGGGYAVHCFANNKSMVVSRNGIFGPGNWGIAYYGKSGLITNNFTWRGNHGHSVSPCVPTNIGINITVENPNVITQNNIIGPCAGSFLHGDLSLMTTNASIDGAIYGCPDCVNTIALSSADSTANFGLSTTAIDNTVAAIYASFSQDLNTILNDTTIETNFAILRMSVPNTSPLFHTGVAWFDANPINIGPDSGAPASVADFWIAFNALGLKNYDAFGNLYPQARVSGNVTITGKATIQ